jgi:hypothetical protein
VFSSYRHFLNEKTKDFHEGEIIVTALPKIKTKGLKLDDINDLMERTKNEMTMVYKKTSEEVTANLRATNKL